MSANTILNYDYCCTRQKAQTKFKELVQCFLSNLDANRGINQGTALSNAINTVSKGKYKDIAAVLAQFKNDWTAAVKAYSNADTQVRRFYTYYCHIRPNNQDTLSNCSASAYDTYSELITGLGAPPNEYQRGAGLADKFDTINDYQFDCTVNVNGINKVIRFVLQGSSSSSSVDSQKYAETINQDIQLRQVWNILRTHAQKMINMIMSETGLYPATRSGNILKVWVKIRKTPEIAQTAVKAWNLETTSNITDVQLRLFPAYNNKVLSRTTDISKAAGSYLITLQHELIHVLHFSHLNAPMNNPFQWINEGLAESFRGKTTPLTKVGKTKTTLLQDFVKKDALSANCKTTKPIVNAKESTEDDNEDAPKAAYSAGFVFWRYVSALLARNF